MISTTYFKEGNPEVNYKGQKTFQKEKGFSIGRERRFPDRTKTEGPGPGN